MKVAPFARDSRPLQEQVEDWISLIDHFCRVSFGAELSPLQSRLLRDAFTRYYHGTRETLTVSRLVERLGEAERHSLELKGWTESIEATISRLYPLTVGRVGQTFDASYDNFDMDVLFEPGVTIIDLSQLPDDGARNLLSQMVLKKLYEKVRSGAKSGSPRLVVVADEAQHLAPNDERYLSIPERCALELRKYGFSLVMIASRPSPLSPNIIANSGTLITHMLNNEYDIERVAGYYVGGSESRNVRTILRTLPVGHALVQLNHPEPKPPVLTRVGQDEAPSLRPAEVH